MSAMQRVKVRGTTRQLMLTKDSLGAVMPPLAAAMPHPRTRVTVNTSTTLMQLSTRLPEAEDQRKEQQNVGSKSRGYKVFLLTARLSIFLRRTPVTSDVIIASKTILAEQISNMDITDAVLCPHSAPVIASRQCPRVRWPQPTTY